MNYTVVIPEHVVSDIESWELPFEVTDALYERLERKITKQTLAQMLRVPAPSPTFVYGFDIEHPFVLGLTYSFTFWLVFGIKDDCLYIHQGVFKEIENWDSEAGGD